jgi:hypothetical protein
VRIVSWWIEADFPIGKMSVQVLRRKFCVRVILSECAHQRRELRVGPKISSRGNVYLDTGTKNKYGEVSPNNPQNRDDLFRTFTFFIGIDTKITP